jgi:hypothetical protein
VNNAQTTTTNTTTTSITGNIVQNLNTASTEQKSYLNYRPLTVSDFGVIRCWARNAIGYQSVPCLFNITSKPAVPPDNVTNCTVNETLTALIVECVAGK